MDRKRIVLAALASGESIYTPVQVQKLFFLIDRNIASEIGGPFFNFAPYNYGPFDKEVYEVLEEMRQDGLVNIVPQRNWRSYQLTELGMAEGKKALSEFPQRISNYIHSVAQFVQSLSFSQLVKAIYHAYPEMKENSVFQG